jgi:ABC-type multidrug transport system permease subunit
MPWIIQGVSYLLPGRYYLAALRAIMIKGVGFRAFGDQVIALLIFAAAAGGSSVLRLRRQAR